MSISLPNGTLLAAPSSTTQQYTAAVTRILHLTNFSPELKTRDLQAMFKEYENEKGGFRIKWLDDVNALVVFNDAGIAKRAYLYFLLHPPSHFLGQIRPYDRPDAAQIIQSLAARTLGHRGSASNAVSSKSSIAFPSSLPETTHARTMSTSSSSNFPNSKSRNSVSLSNGSRGLHTRTGSGVSFSRQPLSGVLNFNLPSISANRLPTHSESVDRSRSASSSDTEPTISMEPPGLGSGANGGASFGNWKMGMGSIGGSVRGMTGDHAQGGRAGVRRDSLSAEKALKEVEKALASVDIQG